MWYHVRMDDHPTEGTLEDVGEYTRMTYALDDLWTVRVLFDEGLNIAGIAISPHRSRLGPPDGGLSAELLGRVRVGDLRRRFLSLLTRDAARWLAEVGEPDAPAYTDVLAELEDPTTQGWFGDVVRHVRPSRGPDAERMDRLAVAALRYIEAFKRDPRRVLVEMEKIYALAGDNISRSMCRERAREARKAGFLIGGRQGRAGAQATEKLVEWQREQAEREGGK